MKVILNILFFLLFILPGFAQKPSEEVKKISDFYARTPKLSVNISYNVYSSHVASIPLEVTMGYYKKNEKDYMLKVGEVTTIQNAKYVLTIDELNKNIVVGNPMKAAKGGPSQADLDTLFKYALDAKVDVLPNKSRRLTFTFSEEGAGEFEKVEVVYNAEKYFLEKIMLYYALEQSLDEEGKSTPQKPKMEIKYSNLDTKPVFAPELFSEKEYISYQGKALVCSGKFKDYQLYDQRLKRK